ncbi:hypothetical protein E1A91_D01G210300v1 [Gossypium mustelinum]|uniref:Uncharacterized protein n=3 Tax=Gossypium TaxID=3633 RepID=A0A5J5SWJ0_GOSBA|nr:hypothetical protein ES319_D01G204100v1 [Gossypium barbadense]TYH88899.1 hypothetical protein ES332_D01G220800v1 [Gossypium tomentosum]TYI98377.1 hypothetical protein E1A91_D01G210300v1 [Gossypium mustelinum]
MSRGVDNCGYVISPSMRKDKEKSLEMMLSVLHVDLTYSSMRKNKEKSLEMRVIVGHPRYILTGEIH